MSWKEAGRELPDSIGVFGGTGTGKTTLAIGLEGKMTQATGQEWSYYGAGQVFRNLMKERQGGGIWPSDGKEVEHDRIDDEMRRLLMEGSSIVEGRVAGLLAREVEAKGNTRVLSIRLDCERGERDERVFERDYPRYKTVEEAGVAVQGREDNIQEVFGGRLGGDVYAKKNADVVIDTTRLSPGGTLEIAGWTAGVGVLSGGFVAKETGDIESDERVAWVAAGVVELNEQLATSEVSVWRQQRKEENAW